jgi:nucleotidyltransferase/DNA polymerase involved in DNA repair
LLKKPNGISIVSLSYLRGKVQRKQDLKTCKKIGRPKMLSDRNRTKLIRIIKALRDKDPNFTVKRLVAHCRLLSRHISYRTFYRDVKAAGFDYLPARNKGVLTSRDRMKRKAFAQQCKKILYTKPGFFWRNIAFYSDGVSSVYRGRYFSS